MADDQQQEEQIQATASLESPVTNNDMVQSVRELMYKDKSAVMIKAVELLVLNLRQQQVVMVLKQTLQEAIEQKEQMLKDLHDQPVMESLMSNIEAQNHSTRKQLGDKVESINMHMKSNEVLRKQLKKEIMGFRSGIDDVKKQIHEKDETGSILHQTLGELLARTEETGKQLRFESGEGAKLQEEYQEKKDKMKKMKSSNEEHVEKLRTELKEREHALKQCKEELAMVKEQVNEKVHACRDMLSEKHNLQNRADELNQHLQKEKAKLAEAFAAEKQQFDQTFGDKADEYKEKIEKLNQTIDSLKTLKEQQQDQIAQLEAVTCKTVEELSDVYNLNEKLRSELEKFEVVLNLEGDSEEVILRRETINPICGEPRVQVFSKADRNTSSNDIDDNDTTTDVSFHMDNAQSSTSVADYHNRK